LRFCFVCLLILRPLSAPADDSIAVELPECPARLEYRAVEPEILRVRTTCPLSAASAARLLTEGLNRLFPDKTLPIRSVFLGRLIDYPDWSERLALAAARSDHWDGRHGKPRPKTGNVNALVARLLNGPAYPAELTAAFAPYKLTPCLGGVEKVLVLPARKAFRPDSRFSDGIPASARLPVDAQVWLKLNSGSQPCRK
jgi:hypothetical protein